MSHSMPLSFRCSKSERPPMPLLGALDDDILVSPSCALRPPLSVLRFMFVLYIRRASFPHKD